MMLARLMGRKSAARASSAARSATAVASRIVRLAADAGGLAPEGYSSARQPHSDLPAAASKRPLFGSFLGSAPRTLCNVSFHDDDSVAGDAIPLQILAESLLELVNQQCNKDIEPVDKVSFVAEDKDLQSDEGIEPVDKDSFMPEEEDLQSDEALWALYQRWCKHFNIDRDHDDMARRFDLFKYRAFLVHRVSNSDSPERLTLNKLADTKRKRRKLFSQAQLAKKAMEQYQAERREKIMEKIWEIEVERINPHRH
ncbi:hypothetical protein ACP70R_014744 [Stipagrostis hirtigluma subsp. patula]